MTHTFLPLGGPIHAELKEKKITFAMGLCQFWITWLWSMIDRVTNSNPNIIAHATGTPNIVEARLDRALASIAFRVVTPSHFLIRMPSTVMIGISSINIAGKVKTIIGRPALASSGRRRSKSFILMSYYQK